MNLDVNIVIYLLGLAPTGLDKRGFFFPGGFLGRYACDEGRTCEGGI